MSPTPVLLYDGDCGICTRLSRFVSTSVRAGATDFAVSAHQDWDLASVGLTSQDCDAALQWVAADGSISAGEDAVAATLRAGRLPWRPLGLLLRMPGVHAIAGVTYRWVAANRHRLPGGTPACSLPAAERPT